jgi:hypothetical protein
MSSYAETYRRSPIPAEPACGSQNTARFFIRTAAGGRRDEVTTHSRDRAP